MKKILSVSCILYLVSFLFLISPALAVDSQPPKGLEGATGRLQTVEKDVYGQAGAKQIEEIIGGYIEGALAMLGVIFLVLLVYGGYIWMLARGEESEVTKAKDIIKMAVIGLVIVLAAYAITAYVVVALGEATGSQ